MALKIKCPHCGSPRKLGEPFPVPGTEIQCGSCGRGLAISYPSGMVERLRSRGLRFTDSPPAEPIPKATPPAPERPPETEPRKEVSRPDFEPLRAKKSIEDDATVAMPINRPPGPIRPNRSPPEDVAKTTARPPIAAEPRTNTQDLPTEEVPSPPRLQRRPAGPQAAGFRPTPPSDESIKDPSTPPATAPPSDTKRQEDDAPPSLRARIIRWAVPAVLLLVGLFVYNTDILPEGVRIRTDFLNLTSNEIATLCYLGAVIAVAVPWMMSRSSRTFLKWLGYGGLALELIALIAAGVGAHMAKQQFDEWTQDLPSVDEIADYYPPTVTTIYDRNGQLMGELYDPEAEGGGRRYVVNFCEWDDDEPPSGATEEDLLCIPRVVQDAFIAAEDANFWTHDGVDYEGIIRAIARNLREGERAQGASTITMQVARNMPALQLSREKSYERKVREVVIAQRMEEAFDKEYILFLYLNQIYLGSQAYGVEAASRVYFNKSVGELSLAEAAILAGLPQRPHDYSPHINWESARVRQVYVLGQMRDKGFISDDEYDDAMDERVLVQRTQNEFRRQAPYFTEEVRRYLERTYGDEKVYQDGLEVHTTCDLELQRTAQWAVREHTLWADRRRGWRGVNGHIAEDEISAWRDEQDLAVREEISRQRIWVADEDNDPGYDPIPESWDIEDPLLVEHPAEKTVYEAVVLEVEESWARVGVGRYEMVIPVQWAWWAREPNPNSSWRVSRRNNREDLTEILEVGDLIDVRRRDPGEGYREEVYRRPSNQAGERGRDQLSERNLETLLERHADLRTQDFGEADGSDARIFVELHQEVELQGAMLSYRLEDGAIQAMVGGIDWERSEFNRAIQSERMVGSTIKPLVYTAAINQGYYHTASRILDDEVSVPTILGQFWRPGNYSENYQGLMTMRAALMKSKNTCTIRILQETGVDTVFDLAGRGLRIGYDQPTCLRTHISEDDACAGERSPSPLAGMQWCEVCDPTTCPLARVQDDPEFECLDSEREIHGEQWCRSCSINLRLCSWEDAQDVNDLSECQDARINDDGTVRCRSCDLSMGLGSSSLTMLELAQGYSAFPTGGRRVEPHFITRVIDGDESRTVIEEWEPPEEGWPRIITPEVAGLGHWLVYQVTSGYGTGGRAGRLAGRDARARYGIAGKTGTTNDFNDAWFIGYTPSVISVAWVGHDENERLGVSSTGGRTAQPIWIEYMRHQLASMGLEEGDAGPRYEVWDELQANDEVVRWEYIDERDPESNNFGTILSEGGGNSRPLMPFLRDPETGEWNMPRTAQVVDTTSDILLFEDF